MKLFLGVDGGQSSTKALIGDESGRVLGAGTGGPCNHARAGEGRAKLERGVTAAVNAACADAGLDPSTVHFDAACFGMSGGPEDKRAILERIVRAGRWVITHDAAIALAGATASGNGILVIAGTGSMAWGRNSDGKSARAGGWGFVFGDEGSAFDIVRQAVRAALRMEEGWGPSTALREVLLKATGARDADDALHRFYTDEWPRSRVAALAPLVDDAAGSDAAARDILNKAAQELAYAAAAVRAQLWQAGEPVEIAYAGGVFRSATLQQRFQMLVELESGNRCGPVLREAAEGALLEARRAPAR